MADLEMTIALERDDRHIPLFMGAVKSPPGLTLRTLEVGMSHPGRDGVARHERFLQNNELDIAETLLSSHVIATSRGACRHFRPARRAPCRPRLAAGCRPRLR